MHKSEFQTVEVFVLTALTADPESLALLDVVSGVQDSLSSRITCFVVTNAMQMNAPWRLLQTMKMYQSEDHPVKVAKKPIIQPSPITTESLA
jgi:hypothetical protein